MRKIVFLLLALACTFALQARKERQTRIYMFGVATCFTDSVVYMTDVNAVESAFISKDGVLPERGIYSYQLEMYFEKHLNKKGYTCAVFWGEKRDKVEKEFIKVRRRFNDDKTTYLKQLDSKEFSFNTVEHIE